MPFSKWQTNTCCRLYRGDDCECGSVHGGASAQQLSTTYGQTAFCCRSCPPCPHQQHATKQAAQGPQLVRDTFTARHLPLPQSCPGWQLHGTCSRCRKLPCVSCSCVVGWWECPQRGGPWWRAPQTPQPANVKATVSRSRESPPRQDRSLYYQPGRLASLAKLETFSCNQHLYQLTGLVEAQQISSPPSLAESRSCYRSPKHPCRATRLQ